MSQRETKSGEDAEEDNGDRITIRPPFDPVEFARQSERPTTPPPAPPPSMSMIVPTPPAWIPPTTVTPANAEGAWAEELPVLGEKTVVELAVAAEDLEWFELPVLARRLIRHVDGQSPLHAVCGASGISIDDAVRLLEGLARDKLVGWR